MLYTNSRIHVNNINVNVLQGASGPPGADGQNGPQGPPGLQGPPVSSFLFTN